MELLAVSDVHVEHEQNRKALAALPPRPSDWLVLAGDVSDTLDGLVWALDTLSPKFAQLVWVPGNHDLWTRPTTAASARCPIPTWPPMSRPNPGPRARSGSGCGPPRARAPTP